MPFLFVGSTGDKAGHSIITWALARALLDRGLRVGFFKPFGTSSIQDGEIPSDADAVLFKKVLALEANLELICPYPLAPDIQAAFVPDDIHSEIASLAEVLARGNDILLIMGSTHMFLDDASHPAPDISVIDRLKTDLVVVHRFRKPSTTRYSLLSIGSLLKRRLKGIIINRIPSSDFNEAETSLAPSLTAHGMPITALLPEYPHLAFQSVAEAARVVDGEVLLGGELLDTAVGAMTVGTSVLPPPLALFKRVHNKLILLKPDDSGLKSGQVAGVIITGGGKPGAGVAEAARKAGVPLITARSDTFACIERIEKNAGTLSYHHEQKVRGLTGIIEKGGGIERLLSSLGL